MNILYYLRYGTVGVIVIVSAAVALSERKVVYMRAVTNKIEKFALKES